MPPCIAAGACASCGQDLSSLAPARPTVEQHSALSLAVRPAPLPRRPPAGPFPEYSMPPPPAGKRLGHGGDPAPPADDNLHPGMLIPEAAAEEPDLGQPTRPDCSDEDRGWRSILSGCAPDHTSQNALAI